MKKKEEKRQLRCVRRGPLTFAKKVTPREKTTERHAGKVNDASERTSSNYVFFAQRESALKCQRFCRQKESVRDACL